MLKKEMQYQIDRMEQEIDILQELVIKLQDRTLFDYIKGLFK